MAGISTAGASTLLEADRRAAGDDGFDAALRESCVVRKSRTNTPLQALVLMNDVTYVEAARFLAARDERSRPVAPRPADACLSTGACKAAFRARTGRAGGGYRFHLERFRTDKEAALALLSTGESPRDESLDAASHTAMTAMASLLLNLDEAVTKE